MKVRDALMDIKVLREVDENGLEQWTPVMKANSRFPRPTFPACSRLRAADADPGPSRVHPRPVPRRAHRADRRESRRHVHKRRGSLHDRRLHVEVTNVIADGRQTRTIAIEASDAAAVIAAVRGAGLGDFVNTPYPAGCGRLAEQPSRFAVIDVGRTR